MSLKKRITEIEKRVGKRTCSDRSLDELWEIITSHEWTDEELDEIAPFPFGGHTYRSLLDIAFPGGLSTVPTWKNRDRVDNH